MVQRAMLHRFAIDAMETRSIPRLARSAANACTMASRVCRLRRDVSCWAKTLGCAYMVAAPDWTIRACHGAGQS